MGWAPDRVAALLRSHHGDSGERTAILKELLVGIQDEGDEGLAAIAEKLADRARDASWRLPLGESGLLNHVLAAVPVQEPKHPLNKQALRLVGNACADCDENRARVVKSGKLPGFITDILGDPKQDWLLPFAIAAALNVCVDYKPAQEQASKAGLSRALVGLVSGDRLSSCESSLSHIVTILGLLSNQDSEPKVANPNTAELLLDLATSERYDADLDSFMEICTPALAYLTFQDLWPVFLDNGGLQVLQRAFHQLYTRFDMADTDADTTSQLKQVGDTFLTVFADISALPSFPVACPFDSKPIQTLIDWLGSSPPLSHLQTAACLSLGNVSRSDKSSTALLPRVQGPLINILNRAIPPGFSESSNPPTSATPLQLTHAALSYLKNLAIPQPNKVPLGTVLLDPTDPLLPRLWTSTRTQPQLQFVAVSLTRLLLANCPSNIRRICAPLARNHHNNPSPSNLALLTSTAASADEDPIKIEAARAVSLVCRALHTFPLSALLDPSWTWVADCQPAGTPSPDSSDPTASTTPSMGPQEHTSATGGRGREIDSETNPEQLTRFYEAHNKSNTIIPSLRHLLTHPRFPSLRSEAIFVLALMSRSSSSPGAQIALQVMQPPPTSNSIISNSTTDTTTPESSRISTTTDNGATWRALAKAIIGSESADLADVFLTPQGVRRVEAVDDEDEREGEQQEERQQEKEQEDAGVTVEKLPLEPQQVDPQGPKAPPARVAEMDRENAMVLVAELLRRFPDELSSLRRPLEAILNKGGELVMQDRGGA